MKYTIEIVENERYGDIGARLSDMEVSEPSTGIAIAHDILEHNIHGNWNECQEELMAFGAIMYVRGESYFYERYPLQILRGRDVISCNLESDIISIYDYYLHYKYSHNFVEDITEEIPFKVYNTVPYYGRIIEKLPFLMIHKLHENCGNVIPDELISNAVINIKKCLILGYGNAAKRYGKYGEDHMKSLFVRIEDLIGKRLKHAEEGERFELSINISKCNAKIIELYDHY